MEKEQLKPRCEVRGCIRPVVRGKSVCFCHARGQAAKFYQIWSRQKAVKA